MSSVSPNGTKALQMAVINGNIATAEVLLEGAPYSDSSIDTKDERGHTPMFYAALNADYPMFKLLLEHGASVKDSTGLLSCAIKADCIEIVETLLKEERHDDDKFEGKLGKKAIWYAVDNINLKMVRLLVAHGAKLSAETKLIVEWMEREADLADTMSLAHRIAEMKQLLTASDWGYKLLHAAVSQELVKVVRCLLDYGADVNYKACDRVTPLPLITVYGNLKHGRIEIMQMLLDHGADVNSKNSSGRTPLHVACNLGHTDLVEMLLKHGALVNCRENYGRTPLHLASYHGHTYVVGMLLKYGTDVNIREYYGRTPIHEACYHDHIDVVEILLKYEADLNSKENYGRTPLNVATFYGHINVVELLLKYGADVNSMDCEDQTPLHTASYNGKTDVLELLLKYKASVNSRDNKNLTALHKICKSGDIKSVEILLKYGVDLNVRDYTGQTPLHCVCYYGFDQLMDLLLKHGADVNRRDNNGRTALHIACYRGNYEILERLLKYGADVTIADDTDKVPITIIIDRKHSFRLHTRIIHILTREMVKWISKGHYVSPKNVLAMSSEKILGYKVKCEEEIALMKKEVFHDTLISFFNILVGNIHSVVGYLRNDVVMEAVTAERYKSQYPLYSHQIENKLMEALKMKDLMERTADIICNLVSKPIPDVCMDRILRFLPIVDMKNVSEAFHVIFL